MNTKTLIIDDDIKLQKLLKEYLEKFGFIISSKLNGADISEFIKVEAPDIIILDIMLPDADGLDLLKIIRNNYDIPVIMLTARGEDTDRIIGLELGADDYLSKPFNPRELQARMKAILRRSNIERSQKDEGEFIISGNLRLNKATYMLSNMKKEVELSTTEYKILEVLMRNPNRVLSRDELMNLARGRDFMAFDRSIDVHISKLRSKVESISGYKNQIKTVWGTGYMFLDKK